MELSVVLPSFNGERFIREAIRSVLREPEVKQLIVVDDASTDRTLEVVEELARTYRRIEVVPLERNSGVAAARNRGISRAKSPWLGFIDQDDVWVESRTSLLAREVSNRPKALAIGQVSHFVDQEVLPGETASWARPGWLETPHAGWVLGAVLVSAETFAQVGHFDETLRQGTDDFEWFARAQRREIEPLQVNRVVLNRRLHRTNQSATAQFKPELASIIRTHLLAKRGRQGHDD